METTLRISGMTCGNCVKHATHALQSVAGVQKVQIDLASGRAEVHHTNAEVADMIAAIEEEGYTAEEV